MLVWYKNIVLEYDQYISFLIQNEIEWVFKKYSQKAEPKNRNKLITREKNFKITIGEYSRIQVMFSVFSTMSFSY